MKDVNTPFSEGTLLEIDDLQIDPVIRIPLLLGDAENFRKCLTPSGQLMNILIVQHVGKTLNPVTLIPLIACTEP